MHHNHKYSNSYTIFINQQRTIPCTHHKPSVSPTSRHRSTNKTVVTPGHHVATNKPLGRPGHHVATNKLSGKLSHHVTHNKPPGKPGHHVVPNKPLGDPGHHVATNKIVPLLTCTFPTIPYQSHSTKSQYPFFF